MWDIVQTIKLLLLLISSFSNLKGKFLVVVNLRVLSCWGNDNPIFFL